MIQRKCPEQRRDVLLKALLVQAAAASAHPSPTDRATTRSGSAPLSRRELGCTIVRRIADDLGRHWLVREAGVVRQAPTRRAARPRTLIFRCVTRAVRAEIRRAHVPLQAVTDSELVRMLAIVGNPALSIDSHY